MAIGQGVRKAALVAAWLAAGATEATAGDRARPIRVACLGGGAGSCWPRPAAMELPVAFVGLGERLALFDGAIERPARVIPWRTRADGSPSWIGVTAGNWPGRPSHLELRATRSPSPISLARRESSGHSTRIVAPALQVTLDAQGVEFATSAAALRLELGRVEWVVDGVAARALQLDPWLLVGPDGAGFSAESAVRFAEEEVSGALHVTVDVAGDGSEAEVALRFQASRDLLVHDLSLGGRLSGERRELACGSFKRSATAKKSASLRFPMTAAQPIADSSAAPAPLAEAAELARDIVWRSGCGRGELELRLLDAVVARPSGGSLAVDGRCVVGLVAEPLTLHRGQVVRRRLRVRTAAALARVVERPYLVTTVAAGQAPLLPSCLAPLTAWQPFLTTMVARPQRIDDRGCYREANGESANGEYDLGGSLLWLGRRLCDGRWLALGETLARHTCDWDRAFDAPAGVPAGLFAQHGRDHASGKVEAGHQWIGGALGLARATGDLHALATAEETVAALANWRAQMPSAFAGPERRVAWPLRAAVELAASTESSSAKSLARALVAEMAARQLPDGFIDGDRRPFAVGERLWVNSWVSLGITVDALARAGPHDPAAVDIAARLARGVVFAAGREASGLADVVQVDPVAGVACETRARVTGGDALLAAAGLAWWAAQPAAAAERASITARAEALRRRGWHDLAEPSEERVVGFAKALHALRSELENRPP